MAGLTLHYLQYVLGLRNLGHDVLYLEDTGTWYYQPESESMVDDVSVPLRYLNQVMRDFDLEENWVFVDLKGIQYGITENAFEEFLQTADMFINVTGAGIVRERYFEIPNRIYVDTDPGYIQLRVEQGSQKDLEHLQKHTAHFSFGHNIGTSSCSIPTCGFDWRPTAQPMVMGLWPIVSQPSAATKFTTILKWQTYEPVEHEGKVYGLKNMEFLKFVDLPTLTGLNFEIAMAGNPPLENLAAAGWKCRDARPVSSTIENYQNYIQSSRGEWSIAKNGYVETRSGWFSDRSASYLASGRPVVLQSTGYEDWLEPGCGLLSFSTIEEASAALELINSNYEAHCLGARRMAEEYFDSKKVLSKLLTKAFEVVDRK